jgi:predicted DsbA family dithiol-disulfide isomerase
MALMSDRVRSTSIEANEFPELSGKYDVHAVPKIVVNDKFDFTGGLPEQQFVDAVLRAISGAGPPEAGEVTAL